MAIVEESLVAGFAADFWSADVSVEKAGAFALFSLLIQDDASRKN